MLNKFLKYLAIASVLGATVIKAGNVSNVSLEYTKEGVLRKDNQCNINFVNFGIKDDITNISVVKESNNYNNYNNNGYFNLKISNLKNGNIGLNKASTGYTFDSRDLKNLIKISQYNVENKNFEVSMGDNGKFSLTIKNLNNCNGLSIKQTFKEPVIVATYLLYSNVKPSDNTINTSYDITEFGPSANDVPYDTVHWDMNTGLDRAREKCRIYIQYKDTNNAGGFHWRWYLSTDNINGENCDNTDFFESVKDSYKDYDYMNELFGDYYEGYVIKREGGDIAHMDGILHNQNYLIEIYQDGCNEQNKDQVICTISSKKELTFKQFEDEFVENCLSIIIDQNEDAKWKVTKSGASAIFSNYVLNIVNYNRGALPTSENGFISYKVFEGATSSGIARFSVSLDCGDGSYIGEKCRCNACPSNCSSCLNETTCTGCKEGSTLVGGQCVCKNGYKEDDEGVCTVAPITITKEETATEVVEQTAYSTSTIEELITATIEETVTSTLISTVEETTTSLSTVEETTTSTSIVEETTPVEEVQVSTIIPEDTTLSIVSTTSTAQPTSTEPVVLPEETIIPSDEEDTPIPVEEPSTPVIPEEPEEEQEEEPDGGSPFTLPLTAAAFAGLAGAAAAVYYKSRQRVVRGSLAADNIFSSNAGLENPLYEGSAAQSENPLYESNISIFSN